MTDVALFYMSGYKYGGFPSFTSHLCRSFQQCGMPATIYKVRTRTEKKGRPFLDDLLYHNVGLDDAVTIAESTPSIITCTEYKRYSEVIDPLLEAGAEVVIHDWTEMKSGFASTMCELKIRPMVSRRINITMLAKHGVDAEYVPMPYVPVNPKKRHRHVRAVALSRLDWDKNSHMIIEANEQLAPRDKIYMWGSNHNRMYLYNKVLNKYDGWEGKTYTGPYYMGPYPALPGFAVMITSNAEFMVDLSSIKGDGGGTQYTFLEAIDAGAVLILHKDWILPGGEFENEVNCLTVGNVDELVDYVTNIRRKDCMDLVANSKQVMIEHSPDIVVARYVHKFKETWEW